MDAISAQQNDAIGQEPKREMSAVDVDEEEAIRKVEAANTPDQAAQSGVRNVEAVTLTWSKTSLACAFVWSVHWTLVLFRSLDLQVHLCRQPCFQSRINTNIHAACGSST